MNNLFLALIPFFGWALGDFFIQKSTRSMSGTRTLFYLCVFSTLIFLPFVNINNLFDNVNSSELYFLTFTGVFGFIYATTIFQAFKIAKLSVVESVIALELPMTVFLATGLLGEKISNLHLCFLFIIFFGIILTVSKRNIFSNLKIHKKQILEKGFYLALASVVLSSIFNYLVGLSGMQNLDSITAIWYIHIVIGLLSFIFMLLTLQVKEIKHDLIAHPYLILAASFFDTIAWAGYIFAVSKNNISNVVAVSEGYIALAAFLGFYFNKEKLIFTQKIGMIIVFLSALIFIFTQ